MKRIRRSPRNLLIVCILLSPIWIPLFLVQKFGEAAELGGDWLADVAVACIFETRAQVKARRTEALRALAGTWRKRGSWVCRCPSTWGNGMDVCPTCGTPQPPNEPAEDR